MELVPVDDDVRAFSDQNLTTRELVVEDANAIAPGRARKVDGRAAEEALVEVQVVVGEPNKVRRELTVMEPEPGRLHLYRSEKLTVEGMAREVNPRRPPDRHTP